MCTTHKVTSHRRDPDRLHGLGLHHLDRRNPGLSARASYVEKSMEKSTTSSSASTRLPVVLSRTSACASAQAKAGPGQSGQPIPAPRTSPDVAHTSKKQPRHPKGQGTPRWVRHGEAQVQAPGSEPPPGSLRPPSASVPPGPNRQQQLHHCHRRHHPARAAQDSHKHFPAHSTIAPSHAHPRTHGPHAPPPA